MAGLGLVDALNNYQQGVAWKQDQQERARMLQQRAAIDEANQAATGVIDASKAEWALNGAQGQYKPNDSTMFKAAEARSAALAKRGLWDHYLQNEAAVAPLRVQARAKALQQYEADGDIEALARKTYPTIFDGQDIVSIEKVGGPASGGLGDYTTAAADSQAANESMAASTPPKLRIKTSGSDKPVEIEPARLVQLVKSSLIDPQTAMKNEIALNFERAKAQAHADAQIGVEKERAKGRTDLQGLKDVAAQGRVETIAGSRERIAEGHDDTRRDVASLRGAGGGSGGGGGGANKVQKAFTGADGNMYAVMKDGTTKPMEVNGKPVASGEYGKRIDSLVKQLRSAPGNYNKSEADLRTAAQDTLATPTRTAPAAGLGLGDAKKDYSNLWTK